MFIIKLGTVQPFIYNDNPFYMKHFGLPEYDKNKPILSDKTRQRAQIIVDALNDNTITIEDAEQLLNTFTLFKK